MSRSRQAESGAGWSDPGWSSVADEDAAPHPFRTGEDQRYERADIAGAGGMGTVYVARDRRLGREVALKQVALPVDDDAAVRRLAREAWITARLEHPGIVPVYDAGESDDGRLFYTMRLIRGRSLADAIAGAADVRQRLALLRHYQDACNALAYAHSRGIVHRDLKPANIMVGAFGETQIVDWGLAGFVDADAARELGPEAGEPGADVAASAVGRPLGTPAYMSPEQAAGAAADRRSDVWGLGAILFELIAGERLATAGGATAAVSAVASGDVDPGRARDAGAPAELCAIAEKALALAPADRYPDASALAADVARFLDGRRVAAHAYSPLALLRRLIAAWRVPIAIGAAGLAVAAAVFAVTWQRVRSERTRAIAAEARTREALRGAQQTLTWALDRQAVMAAAAGAAPEAEIIAAHALAAAESADARGVLAAVYAGARPTRVDVTALPACDRVVPATLPVALCIARDELSLWQLAPARRVWARPGAVTAAALVDDRRVIALAPHDRALLIDAATGELIAGVDGMPARGAPLVDAAGARVGVSDGHEIRVIDAGDGRALWSGRPCGDVPIEAAALGRGLVVAVCRDGRLLAIDPAGRSTGLAVPFGAELKPAFVAAVSDDGATVAIAGVGGEAALVELAAGRVLPPVPVARGPVLALAFAGARVAVVPEHGAGALWDLRSGAELVRFPAWASRAVAARGDVVVTAGSGVWRWELPDELPPWRLRAGAGLSSAALSADGAAIAGARGDGVVTVWARRDGRALATLRVSDGVVKRVAFGPGDRRLAAATSDSVGVGVFDLDGDGRAAFDSPGRGVRRLGYARGVLWAIHYGAGLLVWDAGGALREVDGPAFVDADAVGDDLWLLTADGAVWRWDGDTLAHVLDDPGAVAVTASVGGVAIAVAHADGVRVHAAGATRWLPSRSGALLDVAVSPDGAWVVAGSRLGTADVWSLRTGAVTAVLRGHGERVAFVGFGARGELLTASWDGSVRLWDLAALNAPAAQLIARAERTWGADLATALRGWLP